MNFETRRLALTLAALVLAGCAGATPVHAPTVRPEQLDAEQAKEAARTLVRSMRPARNVAVEATLWETSLLAAQLDGDGDVAEDELERWHERDIQQATTFTVLVEFEQRVGDSTAMDPLLDARAWSFSLERDGRVLDPRSVEMQAIDRFPMESAGHHWRLAMTVRFPGNLHRTLGADRATDIVLRMRMPTIEGPRREGLGRHLTSRGVSMRWRLVPAGDESGT